MGFNHTLPASQLEYNSFSESVPRGRSPSAASPKTCLQTTTNSGTQLAQYNEKCEQFSGSFTAKALPPKWAGKRFLDWNVGQAGGWKNISKGFCWTDDGDYYDWRNRIKWEEEDSSLRAVLNTISAQVASVPLVLSKRYVIVVTML